MAVVGVQVLYCERSLQTEFELDAEARLDEEMVRRIKIQIGKRFYQRLGIPFARKEWTVVQPKSVPSRSQGTAQTAEDYRGKVILSLSKEARNKGLQLQWLSAGQKASKIKKDLTELCETLQKGKKKKSKCQDCVVVRSELEAFKKETKQKAEEDEKRFSLLEAGQKKEEQRVEQAKKLEAELATKLARVKEEASESVKRLGSLIDTALMLRRHVCLDGARQKVLQLLGPEKKGVNETWESFVRSFTEANKQQVGLTPEQLNLLAVGRAPLNRAAHQVNELSLVADAVLKAPSDRATWSALFRFAYGEDPQDLMQNEQTPEGGE